MKLLNKLHHSKGGISMYISEDEPKNSSDKLDKILQETKEILEREKKKKQSKSNNSNSSNDNSYVMNLIRTLNK